MTHTAFPVMRLAGAGVQLHDCEHKTPPGRKRGHPYIAIPNVRDGRLDLSTVRLISDEELTEWNRRTTPRGGDVILTRRGRVGDSAVIWDGLSCAIGQNLVILRSDGSQIDQRFLRWLMRGPRHQGEVAKFLNMGAVFDSLNCADIPKFEVLVPSLAEQRAIAEVLGALDDKIESNRRLAEVVDQLVRTEVAASCTGGVACSVDDLVTSVRSTVQPGGVDPSARYVGLEHMPRGTIILDGWGSTRGLGSAKSAFRPGDILFGKLRPYFKKVALAVPTGGICSTDILVLRPKEPVLTTVALAILASDEFIDFASSAASGTRMPRASWGYMKSHRVVVPSPVAASHLATLLDPLVEAAQRGVEESIVLGELRDMLLPELLSGRLRVRAAEDLVGAAR